MATGITLRLKPDTTEITVWRITVQAVAVNRTVIVRHRVSIQHPSTRLS
jgi:hypothetical protein